MFDIFQTTNCALSIDLANNWKNVIFHGQNFRFTINARQLHHWRRREVKNFPPFYIPVVETITDQKKLVSQCKANRQANSGHEFQSLQTHLPIIKKNSRKIQNYRTLTSKRPQCKQRTLFLKKYQRCCT
ncbi:hypothetical protein T08_9311 [Trichinella sp. T8]|nr:hypothetical protein T08_9311 [Trichinella sp. T8]